MLSIKLIPYYESSVNRDCNSSTLDMTQESKGLLCLKPLMEFASLSPQTNPSYSVCVHQTPHTHNPHPIFGQVYNPLLTCFNKSHSSLMESKCHSFPTGWACQWSRVPVMSTCQVCLLSRLRALLGVWICCCK